MGPAYRRVVHEEIIVKATTKTILEEGSKTLESEILVTFLLGIPKTMYNKMVAAGLEGKTKIFEVQRIAEQKELATQSKVNHSTVLQVNEEEAATITDKAIKTLEEKVAAVTGGATKGRNPNP